MSPLFHNIFNMSLTSRAQLHRFVKCGCSNYFWFNSANLICRGTDISKYFRKSFGIRDNESRLYLHVLCRLLIYEALHSYAFHFLRKNNVKRSRQGGHKAENISSERQSKRAVFSEVAMTSRAYCLGVSYTLNLLTAPYLTLSKL